VAELRSSLEEQSFKNLVWFHASKLRQVLRGKLAYEVFTPHTAKTLRKHGILDRAWGEWGGRSIPSEEALKVLAVLD